MAKVAAAKRAGIAQKQLFVKIASARERPRRAIVRLGLKGVFVYFCGGCVACAWSGVRSGFVRRKDRRGSPICGRGEHEHCGTVEPMKKHTSQSLLFAAALTLTVLGTACSKTEPEAPAAQAPAVEAPAATASAAAPDSRYSYRCESGETIEVTYPNTESAHVQYKGQTLEMQIAVSGSGARYVGGDLEWWSKGSGAGSEGSLLRHLPDGTTGDAVEVCTGT